MISWNPEYLEVTTHTNAADGTKTVTVERWPRQIDVDEVLIANADPAMVQRDGDRLHFTVANGRATYYEVGFSVTSLTRQYQLESSMLQTVTPTAAAEEG